MAIYSEQRRRSEVLVGAAVLLATSVNPVAGLHRRANPLECEAGQQTLLPLASFATLVKHREAADPKLKLKLFGAELQLAVTRVDNATTQKLPTGTAIQQYTGTVLGVAGTRVWITCSPDVPGAVAGGIMFLQHRMSVSIQPQDHTTASASCHHNDESLVFHPESDHSHRPKPTFGRHRRDGPLSPDHSICPVFVDIDPSFHAQWGGAAGSTSDRVSTTATVAAAVLQQVSAMYENQLGVTLSLAGIYLRPTTTSPLPTTGGEELGSYEAWLVPGASRAEAQASRPRGDNLPSARASCLNVLLVNRYLRGTLGTANMGVASAGYVGGVCESYLWRDSSTMEYHALNTAIINTRGTSRVISTTELVSVMAHEIGHLFGAPHVCSSGCSTQFNACNPSPADGGPFLMYPALQLGPNSQSFSPCSLSSMNDVISNKAHCFVQTAPPAVGVPVVVGTSITSTVSTTTTATIADIVFGCFIEEGVDFLYYDLGNSVALSALTVSSRVHECAATCRITTGCLAFSVHLNQCYLKTSTLGRRLTGSIISGTCPQTTLSPTSASVLTPAPPPTTDTVTEHVDNIFSLVGLGCCRTASDGEGTFTTVTATSLAACQSACTIDSRCVAVEYQKHRSSCELHSVPVTHVATNIICACYNRTIVQDVPTVAPSTLVPTSTPSTAPTAAPSSTPSSTAPTMAPTTAAPSSISPSTIPPVSLAPTASSPSPPISVSDIFRHVGDGCCRTADGSAGVFSFTTNPMDTLEACQDVCTAEVTCVAVEYQPFSGTCELHTVPIAFVAQAAICTCYAKQTEAPLAPPQTFAPAIRTAAPFTTSPTVKPSIAPTASPTPAPHAMSSTAIPSPVPTALPTSSPHTMAPTTAPSSTPTSSQTSSPHTASPSATPSTAPTVSPTRVAHIAAPTTIPPSMSTVSPLTSSSRGTVIIGNLALHPSGAYLENMFPNNDMQFPTTFEKTYRDFTVQNVSFLTCIDYCVMSRSCVGFSWWVGGGGLSKCRGLTNLGGSSGVPASKDRMVSYRKAGSVPMVPASSSSSTSLITTETPGTEAMPCSSALCGADCAALPTCGWSTGRSECRQGAHTTNSEMTAGLCTATATPGSGGSALALVDAFPNGGAQFSTIFSRESRVYTIVDIPSADQCAATCVSQPECIGVAWWIGNGGVSKCRGLSDLGTAEGRPISKANMTSFRKTSVTGDALSPTTNTAVSTTAAPAEVCRTATCGLDCSRLAGCGWSSGHMDCRSGARTTQSELGLGVCNSPES